MSSGKKRRTQNDAAVSASLDRSPWVRMSLYLLFCVCAAILVMRVSPGGDDGTALESAMYAFFLSISAMTVIELNHPRIIERNGRVMLVALTMLGQVALMRFVGWIVETNVLPYPVAFLMIPFVVAPMVNAVLLGGPAGVFSAVYVSLLGSLLVGDKNKALFLCVSLISGLVAALALRKVRRRVQLLRSGLYSGLMALLLSMVFGVVDLSTLGSGATAADWQTFGLAAASALGISIGTALLVSGFLPVLEGIFSLTTDISWLEQGDLNHKLLRRMQIEAPGTFHHSLIVASLSEAAAEAVGANAAMCRVCAYYHDIGKLNKPEYFIENQQDGQENPHDSLTPTMSSLIIIAHVKDGVDLALKYRLHPRVIDVIREHHGDSLVGYFYRRAQELKREEMEKIEKKLENPEDLPKVDQKNFRYPGPRPKSRESGIISLADAIESASRTLKKPTPGKIKALVEDLVEARVCDGQLDNCDLTIRDLSTVKTVFAKTLRSMMHSRIDYPKDDRKSDAEAKTNRPDTKTKPLTEKVSDGSRKPGDGPKNDEPAPAIPQS